MTMEDDEKRRRRRKSLESSRSRRRSLSRSERTSGREENGDAGGGKERSRSLSKSAKQRSRRKSSLEEEEKDDDSNVKKGRLEKKKSSSSASRNGRTRKRSEKQEEDSKKSRSKSSSSRREKKKSPSKGGKDSSRKNKGSKKKGDENGQDDSEEENDNAETELLDRPTQATRTVFQSIRGFSLSGSLESFSQRLFWNILQSDRMNSGVNAITGVGLRPTPLATEEDGEEEEYDEDAPVLRVHIHGIPNIHGEGWVSHPVIRVSLVNISTGKFLSKPRGMGTEPAAIGREGMSRVGSAMSESELGGKHKIFQCKRESQPMTTIPALVTEPCNFKNLKGDTFHADWKSQAPLIFNVPIPNLIQPSAALFFEVLDFGPSMDKDMLVQGDGFYPIAWGFLKLTNATGAANFETRVVPKEELETVKLQLFKFPTNNWAFRTVSSMIEKQVVPGAGPKVYHAFRMKNRERYPSSLEVCVSACDKPDEEDVEGRPLHALQRERTDFDLSEFLSGNTGNQKVAFENGLAFSESAFHVARRHRMPQEPCIIPSQLVGRISSGSRGAFDVQFSPDGQYLAASCAEDNEFPIRIYDTNTFSLQYTLSGHREIVYEVAWQSVDEENPEPFLRLASASADGTVRIWALPNQQTKMSQDRVGDENSRKRVNTGGKESFSKSQEDDSDLESEGKVSKRPSKKGSVKSSSKSESSVSIGAHCETVLQHSPPTFIYSVKFHPIASDPPLVATASFDGFVRLWDASTGRILGKTGKLDFGRTHHKSNVNTLAFTNDGNRLISGDADGVVIVWRLETGRQPSNPDSWHVARKLEDPDLKGRPITAVQVHPVERLLLVAAQQNVIRLFELRRYTKVHDGFIGAPVSQSLIRANFSPDGRYVISGSESGRPFIWTTHDGVQCGPRWKFGFPKPLCSLSWHRQQHLVAFTSFNSSCPILIYEAHRDSRDVNAAPIKTDQEVETEEQEKDEEILKSTLEAFQTLGKPKQRPISPSPNPRPKSPTPTPTLQAVSPAVERRAKRLSQTMGAILSSDEDGEDKREEVSEPVPKSQPTTPKTQVKGIDSLRERLARLRSQSKGGDQVSNASSGASPSVDSESDDSL